MKPYHVCYLLPFVFLLFFNPGYSETRSDFTEHGIVSNDLETLQRINEKINNHMYETVPNYNAERWGEIIEHPELKGKFLLIINYDERNPLVPLNTTEKEERKKFNSTEWRGR